MSQVSYHVDNIPNIPQGFDTFLSTKRIMRKLVMDGLGNGIIFCRKPDQGLKDEETIRPKGF